jgi:hypothetical protein
MFTISKCSSYWRGLLVVIMELVVFLLYTFIWRIWVSSVHIIFLHIPVLYWSVQLTEITVFPHLWITKIWTLREKMVMLLSTLLIHLKLFHGLITEKRFFMCVLNQNVVQQIVLDFRGDQVFNILPIALI